MYSVVLYLHSYVRWVVVFAALAAVGLAVSGLLSRRGWGSRDEQVGRLFTSSLDAQVLLGLILYVVSPLTQALFSNPAASMRDPALRFFSVEHVVGMIIALALAHVGRARARRASGRAKFSRAAIFYGLATLALLLSIPWPFYSYGRALFRL